MGRHLPSTAIAVLLSLCFAGAAVADAPSIITGGASSVTSSSASLDGSVDAGPTDSASYAFEYGPTIDYGRSNGVLGSLAAGSGPTAVADTLSGLTPNTTYHFRVVATNDNTFEQSFGDDAVFTTDPSAPTVTAVDPGVPSADGVRLFAQINPSHAPTTYRFEYGTTDAYGSQTPTGDAGAGAGDRTVSQVLQGLTPRTTYHFRVVADNGTGGPIAGPDQTFTTADPAPTVSDVAVVDVIDDRATLRGVVDPHGLTTGTYRFSVSEVDGPYSITTAALDLSGGGGPATVSVPVSGLPSGRVYRANLSVTTSAGSAISDPVTFRTAPSSPYVAPDTATIGAADWPSICGACQIAQPVPASATVAGFTVTSIKTKANSSKASVTVGVPGPGTVSATSARTVKATTTLSKAGTKSLTIRLSAAAQRLLAKARSRRLTTTVTLVYTPAAGRSTTVRKSVTFIRTRSRA